jgi:hypothetical protein
MVDEQIFIEVGKRWVEMMMDPGKKTKNIRHPEWRKNPRDDFVSLIVASMFTVAAGIYAIAKGPSLQTGWCKFLLFKYLSPSFFLSFDGSFRIFYPVCRPLQSTVTVLGYLTYS